MLRVRVTTLTFSDGTVVDVPAEGVTLLVGPNNAGKSQALKDLNGLARQGDFVGRTLLAVQLEKSVTGDPNQWIDANVPSRLHPDGDMKLEVPGWGAVHVADFMGVWTNNTVLGVLGNTFILHADGTSRLTAGDSQGSLDFTTQVPVHPVQRAYDDPDLEKAVDAEARAAFGMGVAVDRYAGATISLRIGDRPTFEHEDGRPLNGYLQALKRLPRLEDQGDGVRSYLGLVLHIASGLHQLLLVDEPEAFLHPPQARRLGGVLAERSQSQQVFLATHSTDVVQGALESDSPITIVRITREGNVNNAAVLKHDAVKQLWSDPILRYSNVLDGLFHDAVVLCEGDADCTYYAAVLDQIPDGGLGGRAPQLLFAHCGGKSRMPAVIDALRQVSVPVVAVSDFDVLRDEAELERIVVALGGDFARLEADVRTVDSALKSDVRPLRRLALKDELVRMIDGLPGEAVTDQDAKRLRNVIKAESGWDKAKRSGKSAVPQGDAAEACDRLLGVLKGIGLLVVPVGELERFAPAVSGHGPAWVTEVLRNGLHTTPSREATEFVAAIRSQVVSATAGRPLDLK